jgi:hypothetical protein
MTKEPKTYVFPNDLNGDTIRERPDMPCSVPWRRHVEIVKPRAGSHRKEGQIYIQTEEAR